MSLTQPTYFVADADCWCEDCANKKYGSTGAGTIDNEGNELGAAFGDESDTPQHCADCGCFLENSLTPDGYAYVAELVMEWIKTGRGNPAVLLEWIEYYGADDTIVDALVSDLKEAARAR